MAELWKMSATELAALIRDPALNVIVIRLDEQTLAAADAADRVVAVGDQLPPLHGVPLTIKECFDLAGTPTTAGWKMPANEYPNRDAPDVQRLKAAGAIPIGRTNLATFTVRWH